MQIKTVELEISNNLFNYSKAMEDVATAQDIAKQGWNVGRLFGIASDSARNRIYEMKEKLLRREIPEQHGILLEIADGELKKAVRQHFENQANKLVRLLWGTV